MSSKVYGCVVLEKSSFICVNFKLLLLLCGWNFVVVSHVQFARVCVMF